MPLTLPDYPPEFWIAAIVAVTVVGMAKAGFGSGPGLLATPLIALTIPVAEAAALLLPLLIVADLISVRHYRHDFDSDSLRVLLPAAVVGIALGAFFFGFFSNNERTLQIGIGLLAVIFVFYQVGRGLLDRNLQGWRPSRWMGYILGAAGGFTSTLAHAGGPPVVIYLLPQKLPRHTFVGTTVVAFMVINLIKLVPYSLLGLLQVGNLLTILLLSPFAFIGVQLGVWLNRRFSEHWFNVIIYTLLLLTGLQLILGRSLLGVFLG
jgi:uncharacterized membrane protein YfcA